MKRVIIAAVIVLIGAAGAAAAQSPFATMAGHYAPIHQALTGNSISGIAEHATAIARAARSLQQDFSAAKAGVPAARAAELREALPEIAAAADRVAAATDLAAARAAFFAMTKPLVLYRGMVGGTRPVVAYCSMEKKSWLQPDGPIANPYDPGMLRCGEIVSR
jgi:hypothetical protein